jgi:hypothetical protein
VATGVSERSFPRRLGGHKGGQDLKAGKLVGDLAVPGKPVAALSGPHQPRVAQGCQVCSGYRLRVERKGG